VMPRSPSPRIMSAWSTPRRARVPSVALRASWKPGAESAGDRQPDGDEGVREVRAMARAGIVEAYEFVCRRCKSRGLKDHSWQYADCDERR
jgi:hypothetical protein